MEFRRVTVNSKQMGGVPCIRGLRIPMATVVGMVADGMTEVEILRELPDLERLTQEGGDREPDTTTGCAKVVAGEGSDFLSPSKLRTSQSARGCVRAGVRVRCAHEPGYEEGFFGRRAPEPETGQHALPRCPKKSH